MQSTKCRGWWDSLHFVDHLPHWVWIASLDLRAVEHVSSRSRRQNREGSRCRGRYSDRGGEIRTDSGAEVRIVAASEADLLLGPRSGFALCGRHQCCFATVLVRTVDRHFRGWLACRAAEVDTLVPARALDRSRVDRHPCGAGAGAGFVVGVTAFDVADASEVPASLVAVAVKV